MIFTYKWYVLLVTSLPFNMNNSVQ